MPQSCTIKPLYVLMMKRNRAKYMILSLELFIFARTIALVFIVNIKPFALSTQQAVLDPTTSLQFSFLLFPYPSHSPGPVFRIITPIVSMP